MTESKSHAYALRRADTRPPYHRFVRCSSRFLALLIATLVATSASAEEVPAPGLVVEVVGDIEAPPAEVRAALLDLDEFGRWFPNTQEWEVLEHAKDTAVAYGRLSLPWPVDDRDYIVRYSWSDPQESEFTLRSEVVRGVGPPERDGVVRVEKMTTTWEVAPLGTGTRVRYVYAGSPGGLLPDWVFEIGWEMQTGILMDALADEVERRRQLVAREAGAERGSRAPR